MKRLVRLAVGARVAGVRRMASHAGCGGRAGRRVCHGPLSQPVRRSRPHAGGDQGQDRRARSSSCSTAIRKTEAVYFAAGKNANGPLAQIRDIGSNDVRSEGMSYGMMIAVQLDKRAEFDALWNWAKTYMDHDDPASPAFGYFSWSLKTDGTPNDEMPAPDGEEYFATALYFAANRWGSGEGIYNYRAEADRILTAMRHRQEITGPTVKGEMTAGNLFDPKHAIVRFTPDVVNWEHTDPSYHLPAFYELWALWGPEADRDFWRQAAAASREFFQTVGESARPRSRPSTPTSTARHGSRRGTRGAPTIMPTPGGRR